MVTVINGYGLYGCVCGFSTTNAFEMQNHRCIIETKETHSVEELCRLKLENEQLKAQLITNKQVEKINESIACLIEIDEYLPMGDVRLDAISKLLVEYKDSLQEKDNDT